MGPNTREQVPEFATIELDNIQVKGKTVGLQIYALMGDEAVAKDPEFVEVRDTVDGWMKAYRAQEWEKARQLIARIRETGGRFKLEILCELYENRIKQYESEPPPPDWDGVFIATTK